MVAASPPIRTSLSPAAARAWSSAASLPSVNEMEDGAAFHPQGRAHMVGQDENRHVVRRSLDTRVS
jgi:hypothetical protein